MKLNWKRLGKPIHHPLVDYARANQEAVPYLKLAIRIASMYARVAPASLEDDLVSVAVEALVAAYKEQDCLDFIVRKVQNACNEFVRREHPSINSTRHAQNNTEVKVTRLGDYNPSSYDLDKEANELWEVILSTAQNPFERDILQLKREGYTDKEIGEMRLVSGKHIGTIRQMLEQRFQIIERGFDAET